MPRQGRGAFTMVELLVVVSTIALLASILLPAVGGARDTALVNVSKSNLRQMGVAHRTYAVDWADRHVTYVRDNLGQYGGSVVRYNHEIYDGGGGHGADGGASGSHSLEVHPPIIAGWGYTGNGSYVPWAYWTTCPPRSAFQPVGFPDGPGSEGWGWFRFGIQTKPMNEYFNGRYHDPVFFAPKDRFVLAPIENCFDRPGEFVGYPEDCNPAWSSYSLSPAGLYHPGVFSNDGKGKFWNPPWTMPAGYRVPSFGHVKYPTLKTHMLEHHWLQNNKEPYRVVVHYCTISRVPYYFNHSILSMPVTMFYDGSVRLMGVLEAMSSDRRHERQAGYGLWTRDTSFGSDGYFIADGYDYAATSFHILTTDGVRGRDTLGRE
ncbi:MAG: type II secretion system protein [Planctomycetota bacterium]